MNLGPVDFLRAFVPKQNPGGYVVQVFYGLGSLYVTKPTVSKPHFNE